MTSCVLVSVVSGPTADAARYFEPGSVRPGDGTKPAQIERSQIERHLEQVERTLRRESPAGLSEAQRAARGQVLDALHAYRMNGVFPKNRDYPDRRVPYFVDDDGVACAVGQLMIASGAEDLAREIATYENNDFLADIDHPEVPRWLHANGLTVAEAAWIQPTYGPCGFSGELVCGTDGVTYECEYIATECAGVEVAVGGACGSDTDTDAGTGGGGPIVGPEICPAETTDTGEDTSTNGDTSTSGSTSDSTSASDTSGASSESGGDDEDDGKGCAIGSRPTAAPLFGLVVLAALRRKRR
jgi:hypothetical protein